MLWSVQASAHIKGYAAASKNAIRGRCTDSSHKRAFLQVEFVELAKIGLPDESSRATIQESLLYYLTP